MRTTSRPGGRAQLLRRAAGLAATAALLGACGEAVEGAPPHPTGSPSVPSCVTPSGDLLADIDGDGLTDRVSDPSRTGARLTVAFGEETGYGTPVGVRKLVGGSGSDEKDVLAAVADFDGDGWNDLVVVATGRIQGDDAIEPTVDELISGPFSASGQGQRTRHLDLGETRGIAVADYDHDPHPDLAVFSYAGDGVYQTEARLGDADTGLADATADTSGYRIYADQTDDDTPSNMPDTGLSTFYPTCGKTDGRG
ncbi:FG-GAP repeat domain-containing protein [Streptomyces sp. NPDC002680]|uniref:FG-GAP repeat domain-containing protein n=1 Tax=Streptomyces sp. NPDC002680 TaxID=3364659 RepID=UPI0036773F09